MITQINKHMKTAIWVLAFALLALVSWASCQSSTAIPQPHTTPAMTTNQQLRISIGNKTFTATLTDTPTARAFVAQLPLTLHMIELNANEKYADLPKPLPTDSAVPSGLRAGDLMLYGSRTLVLFYKNFSTPYSYTRIGKVDDPTGLAEALGASNVTVRFEVII